MFPKCVKGIEKSKDPQHIQFISRFEPKIQIFHNVAHTVEHKVRIRSDKKGQVLLINLKVTNWLK